MKKSSLLSLAYLMVFSANVFSGNFYQGQFSPPAATWGQRLQGQQYQGQCRHLLVHDSTRPNNNAFTRNPIWNKCIMAWAENYPQVYDEKCGPLCMRLSEQKKDAYKIRDQETLKREGKIRF
jgi:hypothetical protein